MTQADHDLAKAEAPWWTRASVVTTLTAIVAAIVPVTTGVNGCLQKQRELDLEMIKQTDQIRGGYLDRTKDPIERERTLAFLIETTSDDRLLAWATKEKGRIEVDANEQRKELEATKAESAQRAKALNDAEQRSRDLEATASAAQAQASDCLAKVEATNTALQSARQTAEQQRARLAELSSQADQTPSTGFAGLACCRPTPPAPSTPLHPTVFTLAINCGPKSNSSTRANLGSPCTCSDGTQGERCFDWASSH
jgi:hypothetical protein